MAATDAGKGNPLSPENKRLFFGMGIWLCWFAWAVGVGLSQKTPAAIFGLVFAGLIILGLSIYYWKGFLMFLSMAVAFPFVPPFMIFMLLRRLLSIVVVFNPSFPWNPKSRSDYCRLCDRCNALVANSHLALGARWLFAWPKETHGPFTRSDLGSSSRQCHLCQLLFSTLEDYQNSTPATASTTTTAGGSGLPIANTPNAQLFVKIRKKVAPLDPYSTVYLSLRGPSVQGSIKTILEWKPKDDVRHRCHDSLTTDSPDVFDWARSWIEKCNQDHPRCRNEFVSLQMKTYLPLRLIDIDGNTNDGTVRVLPTAQVLPGNPQVDYCALSHCWGGANGFKLTKTNLATLATGIQTHSLPQTFRDAISATGKLGMRYIWIDSLCIVQDDSAEWETQSTKMGFVYANAKCVLSATSSRDSAGGCFRPRSVVHYDCSIARTANKVLVVRARRGRGQVAKLFKSVVETSPLTTRGWTFQERYLASRTLHFCEGAVYFECGTLQASEGMQGGKVYAPKPHIQADGKLQDAAADVEAANITTASGRHDRMRQSALLAFNFLRQNLTRKNVEKAAALELKLKGEQKEAAIRASAAWEGMRGAFDFLWRFTGATPREQLEFHARWFEMVGDYSARQLTVPTDKAIAIAGVASIIQQNTALTYAAGLWKELLLFNLLWFPEGNPAPRPTRRAPTWSWISVDGKITHSLPDDWQAAEPLISGEALKQVEKVGDLVHNATLRLTGQVRPLELDNVNLTPDTDERFRTPLDELRLLPVVVFTSAGSEPGEETVALHGIVVRQRGGSQQGYKRVGYFSSTNRLVVDRVLAGRQDIEEICIM